MAAGRGRKPIPSKIIDLKGGTSHTHRPARTNEPKPPEKLPTCPKYLDALAKKEWRRAGKVLAGIGLLTDLDLMIFAAYCDAYSRWVQAVEHLNTNGTIGKKKDGSFVYNPNLRIANDAREQMIKAGVQLGLSPSSRVGLKVETKKPKTKAEAFKEEKNR